MNDVEALFCKQELGDDWYAGWHSECGGEAYAGSNEPPTYCPNCGKRAVLGKVLDMDVLWDKSKRE